MRIAARRVLVPVLAVGFAIGLASLGRAGAPGEDRPQGLRGDPAAHVLSEIARAKTTRLGPVTAVERGRRIFAATGGCTCHTNYPGEGDEAPELAGGRALETPFGIFYSTRTVVEAPGPGSLSQARTASTLN